MKQSYCRRILVLASMMFLVFAGIYALGAVDAFVDAHLSGFDISDDLTFSIEPSAEPLLASGVSLGMSLKIKF